MNGSTKPGWWPGTALATTTTRAWTWKRTWTGRLSFWIYCIVWSQWPVTNSTRVSWTSIDTAMTCAAGMRTFTRSWAETPRWPLFPLAPSESSSSGKRMALLILSDSHSFPDPYSWWRVLRRRIGFTAYPGTWVARRNELTWRSERCTRLTNVKFLSDLQWNIYCVSYCGVV